MNLNSHYALPLGALAVGSIEVAANAGATPAHFIAAGAVIGTIVGIVKVIAAVFDWGEKKSKGWIHEALALHNAEDQRRHDLVKAQVERLADQLERRPCIAGKCRNHEE